MVSSNIYSEDLTKRKSAWADMMVYRRIGDYFNQCCLNSYIYIYIYGPQMYQWLQVITLTKYGPEL